MRRRAETERAQQMPELRLLLRIGYSEDFEQSFLQIRFVNPQRAAANFNAVQDDIVGFGTDFSEFAALEERKVLGVRTRKRMMHGVPFIVGGAEREQRKIDYPKEIERGAVGGKILNLGDAQSDPAEDFADNLPLIRAEQNEVALFDSHFLGERRAFGFMEKLHDRRFP